jgi:hypothetical protein
VGGMPVGLLQAASESPVPVLVFKDLAAGVQSVVTVIALIVGGIWAYYKFFRSRTFVPRLEGSIDAKVAERVNGLLLDVNIQLKNVSLTRLDIIQKGPGSACLATTAPSRPSLIEVSHGSTSGRWKSSRITSGSSHPNRYVNALSCISATQRPLHTSWNYDS